ncbi:MAG TPA: hypothetical protein VK663_07215, partial [Burkholderiales bacterium]|nr:hypothetical protein [Burkholderiales bacterium]
VNDGTTYSAARYNVSVFVQPSLIPGPDITGGPVVTPPSDPPVIPGVPPAAPVAPTATGNNPNAIGDKGLAPVPATEQTEVRVALIDAGASPQGSVRTDGIVDVRQTRNTTSGLIHLLGAVPITLERGTTQIGLEAFSSTDALIAGRITSATNSATFTQELDRLREDTKAEVELERNIVVSSVTAGAGMSVGYVFWLLRGGLLMTSLLSSLPAWRFVDPLPILGRLKDDGDEDDNESLESIVGGEDSESGQVGDERNA